MDQIPDSSTAKNRRQLPGISRVLGCFGREQLGRNKSKPVPKKKTSWLSFSRNKIRKSPRKTVPVDSASYHEKGHLKKYIFRLRKSTKKKCSFFDQLQSEEEDGRKGIPAPALEETNCNGDKGINIGNGKSKTTCKQRASKYTSSTTLNISHANPQPYNCLFHSISSQHIYNNNPTKIPKNIQDNDDEKLQEEHDMIFDQLYVMSVLTVVFVIMTIWGKLCAILCSCAYLYIYPFLRTKIQQNVSSQSLVSLIQTPESTKRRLCFEKDHRSIW